MPIREALERVQAITGQNMNHEYEDRNREGDHICYISDLSKMKQHYPQWNISKSLDDVLHEIVQGWRSRPA